MSKQSYMLGFHSRRVHPWEVLAREQPELLRRYNDLRNRLRLAFRAPQEEAYKVWSTLEEQLETP